MPIFCETGVKSHKYLFMAGSVLLALFLIYVFVCEHQDPIIGNSMWTEGFIKENINPENITHDDSMWYHNSIPTCVAYEGDFKAKCSGSEHYCAGGEYYGTDKEQVRAVKKAICNGGEHPLCPLIYQGTD